MEIDDIKSGAPNFEGNAHLSAWLHTDESGAKHLVLEIGNSGGLGSLTTLIMKSPDSMREDLGDRGI